MIINSHQALWASLPFTVSFVKKVEPIKLSFLITSFGTKPKIIFYGIQFMSTLFVVYLLLSLLEPQPIKLNSKSPCKFAGTWT